MKKSIIFALILSIGLPVFFSSCKSEFEKVRASGDSELLYKKAYEYYDAGDYLKAQTIFELLIGAYRGKKELEDIYYKYADTYYQLERYILSAYYFESFTSTFPTSAKREDADFMVAYSNYQMAPSYRLDQTFAQKAIDEFQSFVNTYPESERVAEANTLIDRMRLIMEKKAFETAELYYDLKQYQAALVSYETVLAEFPETTNAELVRYKSVKAAYEMAANSVYAKREKRYKDARKAAQEFLDKYGESDYAKEVQTLYADTQDKLKDFKNG